MNAREAVRLPTPDEEKLQHHMLYRPRPHVFSIGALCLYGEWLTVGLPAAIEETKFFVSRRRLGVPLKK